MCYFNLLNLSWLSMDVSRNFTVHTFEIICARPTVSSSKSSLGWLEWIFCNSFLFPLKWLWLYQIGILDLLVSRVNYFVQFCHTMKDVRNEWFLSICSDMWRCHLRCSLFCGRWTQVRTTSIRAPLPLSLKWFHTNMSQQHPDPCRDEPWWRHIFWVETVSEEVSGLVARKQKMNRLRVHFHLCDQSATRIQHQLYEWTIKFHLILTNLSYFVAHWAVFE